jgi:integrase/recombinase XerC
MNEIDIHRRQDKGRAVIAAFMSGRTATTRRAYLADLDAFADHIGAGSAAIAFDALFDLAPGDGNAALLAYRGGMLSAGLSPATVNRRLSTIRSLVKIGRTLGFTEWRPEVASVKSQSFRDTAGPGIDGVVLLLAAAARQTPAKAARDRALVRLLFDLAMRRNEASTLDVEHLDLDRSRVMVLGKGHLERVPMTLPDETVAALREWLTVRARYCPPMTGPLLISLSGPTIRQRLSGDGIWLTIGELGKVSGIKVRPHGLRHASITAVLDATNGDIRAAQRHGRHASANTTLKYDDNRSDIAGQAARTVAGLVK